MKGQLATDFVVRRCAQLAAEGHAQALAVYAEAIETLTVKQRDEFDAILREHL